MYTPHFAIQLNVLSYLFAVLFYGQNVVSYFKCALLGKEFFQHKSITQVKL